jgi:hypothetical protein
VLVSGRTARLAGARMVLVSGRTARLAGARMVLVSGRTARLDGPAPPAGDGRFGAQKTVTGRIDPPSVPTTSVVATGRTGQAAPVPPPAPMARGLATELANQVGRAPVTGITPVLVPSA